MLRRWLDERPEVAAHDVVTRAMHRAGRDDFDGTAWSEPLEVLTRSLDREARLHHAGRRRARDELIALLASRDQPRPPTVAGAGANGTAAPARPVVIIAGLEGSGASELAELVAGPGGDSALGATLDESEFVSLSFEQRWHLPRYAEWLAATDPDALWARIRRRVDALAATPGPPIVLSGAQHLEHLDAIARAFPDATLVQVHRDTAECVAITVEASIAARRNYSDQVDPLKVARYWAWRIGVLLERNALARSSLATEPAARVVIDVASGHLAEDAEAIATAMVAALPRNG